MVVLFKEENILNQIMTLLLFIRYEYYLLLIIYFIKIIYQNASISYL
jgi:hypothetical protein